MGALNQEFILWQVMPEDCGNQEFILWRVMPEDCG